MAAEISDPLDATFRAAGWLAHGNGEPAAPALNVDVRAALENLPVGHSDVMRIMRAFQRGWMDANFAADVPGDHRADAHVTDHSQ